MVVNVPWTDTNYSLPLMTATVRGGAEIFSDIAQAVAANGVSSEAGRTYGLQLNAAEQLVVNVPWTDTAQYSFTAAASGGITNSITDGNTLTIAQGVGIVTTGSATDTIEVKMADTPVTPGTYTNATITVDQQGRLTSAGSGDSTDRQPSDFFSFNTSGIVNQGKSSFSGNNAVSGSASFVYTVTFNQTRANTSYLICLTLEPEAGKGCHYCEIRNKTTTGFIVELLTCANGAPSGVNPNINVTIYS